MVMAVEDANAVVLAVARRVSFGENLTPRTSYVSCSSRPSSLSSVVISQTLASPVPVANLVGSGGMSIAAHPSALHLEHLCLVLCVPHAVNRSPSTRKRRSSSSPFAFAYLDRHLQIAIDEPIPIPAQEMQFVRMQRDSSYCIGASGTNHYRMVFLSYQYRTSTPENCYTPVLVNDIFTNGSN